VPEPQLPALEAAERNGFYSWRGENQAVAMRGMQYAIPRMESAIQVLAIRPLPAMRQIRTAKSFEGSWRRIVCVPVAVFAIADIPMSAVQEAFFFHIAAIAPQFRELTSCCRRPTHTRLSGNTPA